MVVRVCGEACGVRACACTMPRSHVGEALNEVCTDFGVSGLYY